MRRWLGLLVLVIFPSLVQGQAAPLYRYGYMTSVYDLIPKPDQPDWHETLHLINGTDPSQPAINIALPDYVYVCGDPSPDGRWLIICYHQDRYSLVRDLMLMDMQTGAIRKVEPMLHDDDSITRVFDPEWSYDSAYLALNEYSLSLGSAGITLYDVQADTLIPLSRNEESAIYPNLIKLSDFYLWMPESHYGLLQSRNCTKPDLNIAFQCHKITLELRHMPDMALEASIEAPGDGWSICNVSGSPSGRYLSFEAYCDDYGVHPAYRELYVWDTLQNRIDQLTSNTDPSPDKWYNLPHRYASYMPLWYDWRTLILGVRAETLIGGDNGIETEPGSISARTELYQFDGKKPTILMNDTVVAWAKNPVSGEIAFQNIRWGSDPDYRNQRVIAFNQVSLSQFDGQNLNVQVTADGGCNHLKWSPDGLMLAYPVPTTLSNRSYCYSDNSERIRFLTKDGRIQDYLVPHGDAFVEEIGWLQAPDTLASDKAYFLAGTPTLVPTPEGMG